MKNTCRTDDPFDLERFIDAQDDIYDLALSELKEGEKQSHWMWFIFPQIDGLGYSSTAKFYAIKNLKEACAYLNHPILGTRLLECSKTVLNIDGLSVSAIFGIPDNAKFKSSMTLFAAVSDSNSVFEQVLDKFFNGNKDNNTLQLLK